MIRISWATVCLLLGVVPAAADLDTALARLASGDFARALPELHVLAGEGDVRAQGTLAGLYLEGIGVDRDVVEAMGWYCRVAHDRRGGPEVMHAVWYLAEYFRTGGGVPGRRYNQGRVEDENPLRAYFWFSVMAAQRGLYERVDARSEILGEIGVNAVGGVLLEGERVALGEALERWRPTRPVASAEACLGLPEGLMRP
jgi:TPR repeat protein